MSDNAMTYRIVVKEIANQHGAYATFMPKPLFGENGSGMHTHQSLFSDGSNAFFDSDDQHHLSGAAKSYIAGLLRHAREISALFAPNVNSYKRLVPGYEAPVYCAWSQRNRSALVRVPVYHPGKEQATRCELRCPDPSCNPYLAFAVMLAAGMDGIARELPLPEPVEENLYHFTDEDLERRNIPTLPATLGEAVAEMKADPLIRGALGDHVFERLTDAQQSEWDDFRRYVSQWERDRYLESY
jgi:glutamine synthetase